MSFKIGDKVRIRKDLDDSYNHLKHNNIMTIRLISKNKWIGIEENMCASYHKDLLEKQTFVRRSVSK